MFTHFSIICVLCFIIVSHSFPVTEEIRAAIYLQKCGYLDNTAGNGYPFQEVDYSLSNALKDFQQFNGLKQTGLLDSTTTALMKNLRCRDKKNIGHSSITRKKIYAFLGINATLLATEEIGNNLDLGKTDEKNIPISTCNETYLHSYMNDLEAKKPLYGDSLTRTEAEEPITIDKIPSTPENNENVEISQENVEIRASLEDAEQLGSENVTATGPKEEPSPEQEISSPAVSALNVPSASKSPPNVCLGSSIDAATRTQNGHSYFFKGDFYWRVLDNKIAYGYPRRIANDWSGLDGNLDAAFTWSNGWTFIFKGSLYWKSINNEIESGYPKLISQGFPGLPDNIDAAFVSPKDGKTYFFKGDKYWQHDSKSDPPVDNKYPLPISDWSGLPNNLDAAFQFENTKSYFFKSGTYYRIYDDAFRVDVEHPPYPRSTSVWWFFC